MISTPFDGITEAPMISGRSSYVADEDRDALTSLDLKLCDMFWLLPEIGVSISLQLDRRRLAGRGLERRPTIAREARRPTRGTPEEGAESVLKFH